MTLVVQIPSFIAILLILLYISKPFHKIKIKISKTFNKTKAQLTKRMFRDFDQSTRNDTSSIFSRQGVRNKDYYKKNKLTGIYRDVDPITGEVVEEGSFQNGVEVGLWKVIDADGDQQHFRYSQERVGARCGDGTLSSATGRGACSWHGGVAEWLTENKRQQVGGTGKYEPVETRIQRLKTKLKQELKMKIDKGNQQLFAQSMEKLLKINKQLKMKEQNQERKEDQNFEDKVLDMRKQYEEEIEKLQEEIALVQSAKQAIEKQNKDIKSKLAEQQISLATITQSKQRENAQNIRKINNDYEQKLRSQQREILSLRNQLKQATKAQSKAKQQSQAKIQQVQKKKTKQKDNRQNDLLKKKLKLLQEQISILNQSLYKEQKDQHGSSEDDSNEEIFSSIAHKQEEKGIKRQQPKLKSESSISRKQESDRNESFSYQKILKSKLFMDGNNKSELSYYESSKSRENSLFLKKENKVNMTNNQIKGKFQFKLQEESSDEGVSLRTDSEDEDENEQKARKNQSQEQQRKRKEDEDENRDVFKSIPFKSGNNSEINLSKDKK